MLNKEAEKPISNSSTYMYGTINSDFTFFCWHKLVLFLILCQH